MTYYWTPTIEEADTFETYTYDLHPMASEITKFYKKSMPYFVPSENPNTIKENDRLLNVSNREDMYVLEREKEAFDAYYEKEKAEILPYLK